jgi:hypothetical protein
MPVQMERQKEEMGLRHSHFQIVDFMNIPSYLPHLDVVEVFVT